QYGAVPAAVWDGVAFTYASLRERGEDWGRLLHSEVPPGSVVALVGDYSPDAISALLGLIRHGCVVVPLTTAVGPQKASLLELAECEWCLDFSDGTREMTATGR